MGDPVQVVNESIAVVVGAVIGNLARVDEQPAVVQRHVDPGIPDRDDDRRQMVVSFEGHVARRPDVRPLDRVSGYRLAENG